MMTEFHYCGRLWNFDNGINYIYLLYGSQIA